MTQVQVDAMTGAADFSLVIGGIAAVAGTMAAFYVAYRGGKFIISALRSL